MRLNSDEREMFLSLIGEYQRAEGKTKYVNRIVAYWIDDHARYNMAREKRIDFIEECLSAASAADETEDAHGRKGRRRYCVRQEVEVDGKAVLQTLWADIRDLIAEDDRTFLRMSFQQRLDGIEKDKRAVQRDLALVDRLFEEAGKPPLGPNLWGD
jgi:hypothetical protein